MNVIKPQFFDRTKVTGILESDAQILQHADGSSAVCVRLLQPGGLPVIAERSYGNGQDAKDMANLMAKLFVKGSRCTATGFELKLDSKAETIHLTACTTVSFAPIYGALQ